MSAASFDHAARARARKAQALVRVLERHPGGTSPAVVAELPQDARDAAAVLAGVPSPSPATWACVVGLLEANLSTAGDPFAGIPTKGHANA